jgi:alpha-beta hydrolase superfamily lysophospholipase
VSEAAIEEEFFRLPARGGHAPLARRWSAGAPPRAMLVVAHGMGEHAGRYLAPLAPIIRRGVDVAAIDHRGHGEDARAAASLGDSGEGGFAGVEADLLALVDWARAAAPSLPVILLGHSMGSMIAQALAIDHGDRLDGLILSGSVAVDHIPAGGDPAGLIAALNSPFEPARTPFDWLSRDEAEVDLYLADPLCGFGLTDASFASLAAAGPRLADPASLAAIPDNLPIYIFSGDRDPLHCVLGGLTPLIERYRAGGKQTESRLYAGGRHEMLNETNRAEVVGDLWRWLEPLLSGRKG